MGDFDEINESLTKMNKGASGSFFEAWARKFPAKGDLEIREGNLAVLSIQIISEKSRSAAKEKTCLSG